MIRRDGGPLPVTDAVDMIVVDLRDKMSRGLSKPQDWQREMCNDDKASSMSIGVG